MATSAIQEQRQSEGVRLMRQWVASVLEPHAFISLPILTAEGEVEDRFYQVLQRETRPVVVPTIHMPDDEPALGLYTITAQVFERWNPKGLQVETGRRGQEEVFRVEDPVTVDVLGLCGGVTDRRRWLRWSPGESDVDGCMTMSCPTILAPREKLSSTNTPVLCLLDALDERGFHGADKKIMHHVGQKEYDSRAVVEKKVVLAVRLGH